MKLTGQIKDFSIKKYYVTGSLKQKIENKALQNMLLKIKNGGMNAFLNDKELNRFAKGLKESFEADGYINSDNSLTSFGEDIVSSGKSWKGLKGAFFFTVLEYKEAVPYLLDVELVGDRSLENGKSTKDLVDFQKTSPARCFTEDKYVSVDSEFREIETDEQWAVCREQPKNCSVRFSFDYEDEVCEINVKYQSGQKDKSCKFFASEHSKFAIIELNDALNLLEAKETSEGIFDYSRQDRKSLRLSISKSAKFYGKTWFSSFFKTGSFYFENVDFESNTNCKIEDVHLYIDTEDSLTAELFLQEYLIKKAEIQYLGYEETGHLVNDFQNLFTSPDGKSPASPAIMKDTKEIYNQLVERAKENSSENPVPYLHLQAYIDLSPSDTLKPYIEKETAVNLSNQTLNFSELVKNIFGQERNIKSIQAFSKYTASNGRNARAFMLFAESIAQNYGIKSTLITTKEEVRPNANSAFRESDQKWFSKMKTSKHIHILEKPVNEIKSIHDRYYKVIKNDGREEWWVMTGELDSLRFENDNPRIRDDISINETGIVKEMTFAKIKKQGVPEIVTKLMGEN